MRHGPDTSSRHRQTPDTRARGLRFGNAILALTSLLFSLFAIEIAFRLAMGLPTLALFNWRADHTVIIDTGDVAVPDPVLGWVSRPGYATEGYHTLANGIRRNFAETEIRPDAILAVGDSFTEGMDVDDDESWPAYLEKITGQAVLNAGVMAYGTDQIILRAEQLLPIVKPKTLIVGFLEFDVFRAGHTQFGSPKPYFVIENGALRYHSPELVNVHRDGSWRMTGYRIRHWLGYFASLDYLMRRLAPDFWLGSEKQQYLKAPSDPVRVTCALLERLKQRTSREGVRMMLFMQYYARSIIDSGQPTENAQKVIACAKRSGIQVVDQFHSLRALIEKDRDALRPYYVIEGDTFMHMSAKGNEQAARLLVKALEE